MSDIFIALAIICALAFLIYLWERPSEDVSTEDASQEEDESQEEDASQEEYESQEEGESQEIEEGCQQIATYIKILRRNGAESVYVGITNDIGRRKSEHEETIQERCEEFEYELGKSFFYVTCRSREIAEKIERRCHHHPVIHGVRICNKPRTEIESLSYGSRNSRKVYVCMWEWR